MNSFVVAAGFLVLFLAGYFILHPREHKKILQNMGVFTLTIVLGFGLFFQESLGGKVLANYDFGGKIKTEDAEIFVAEKYDIIPYYSWYATKGISPLIIIKGEKNGAGIFLSPKEFGILEFLIRSRGHIKSRTQILEYVWGEIDEERFFTSDTLEVHISYIRKKLGKEIIQTVRGVGYKIFQITL